MRRSAVAVVAGVVLAAGVVTVPAPAAHAHDSLVASSPAADDTVTSAITEVTLTFSASLLGGTGNAAIVTGPDGRFYETDCVAVAGPDITLPVALGAEGIYEVQWRAVSSDGHPVSGDFAFAYAPTGSEHPSTGADTHACADVATADDRPAAGAAPSDGGTDGLTAGLVVGGVVVALVAVAVLIILRPWRRRPAPEPIPERDPTAP